MFFTLLAPLFFLNRTTLGSGAKPQLQNILILDVDGTLYGDDCEVEQQLKRNSHAFAKKYGYSPMEAQRLHHAYGSTLRGILQEHAPPSQHIDITTECYNEVYQDTNMMRLRKYNQKANDHSGYQLENHRQTLQALHTINSPIIVASNSPVFHVRRVLHRLGLAKLPISMLITPEQRGGVIKNEASFWDPIFEIYPSDRFRCTLIDDNVYNIQAATALGMDVYHVTPEMPLQRALLMYLGILPRSAPGIDDKEYLQAKNAVDRESFHPEVKRQLQEELKRRLDRSGKTSLVVVDLGAGLLMQLEEILVAADSLESLENLVYIAYEQNTGLTAALHEKLTRMGLSQLEGVFEGNVRLSSGRVLALQCYLSVADFTELESGMSFLSGALQRSHSTVDLIIGQ